MGVGDIKTKSSASLVLTTGLLVTGNLVGAGILGLPVNTGLDGFVPSLVAMLVFGGAMCFTALILSGQAIARREENFNYPSLYERYLGPVGKWIATLANLLILYGLLTAYLTGAATIVTRLCGTSGWFANYLALTVLFLALTGFALGGLAFVRKYNTLLMILLWVSFGVIVFIAGEHVEPVRLKYKDWGFLPVAIPIIVTSFHFHNIIPNVCHELNWDMSKVWKTVALGMGVGYVMNAAWILVGVGALPLAEGGDSVLYSFRHNIPATVPMIQIIHSKTFTVVSMLFALLSIATSYITNGIGLMGFNRDLLLGLTKTRSRKAVIVATFLPPLVISLVYPSIFLKAINVVGGIGIVTLFGVLPCVIALIRSGKRVSLKVVAIVFLVLFASVLTFQVAEEFGWIKINPKAEDVVVDPETGKYPELDRPKFHPQKE